jgi:hypothetical protein
MRCHGFAGAAPSGVEVDYSGAIALEVPVFGVVLIVENVREEVFVGDFFCFHCVDVEWSLNRDYLFSIGNHCKSKQRMRYKQISKGNKLVDGYFSGEIPRWTLQFRFVDRKRNDRRNRTTEVSIKTRRLSSKQGTFARFLPSFIGREAESHFQYVCFRAFSLVELQSREYILPKKKMAFAPSYRRTEYISGE